MVWCGGLVWCGRCGLLAVRWTAWNVAPIDFLISEHDAGNNKSDGGDKDNWKDHWIGWCGLKAASCNCRENPTLITS